MATETRKLEKPKVEMAKPAPTRSIKEPLVGKREKVIPEEKQKELDAALRESAYAGKKEEVERLLKARANVDAGDEEGHTALIIAAKQGHTKVVNLLLANGAYVEARDILDGQTALMKAAMGGNMEVVQLLIDAKADVNARSYRKDTALMNAAYFGYTEVAKLLIAAGANVNAVNKKGDTALEWAVNQRNYKFAALLRAHGAED